LRYRLDDRSESYSRIGSGAGSSRHVGIRSKRKNKKALPNAGQQGLNWQSP
jgi:hypothetical protein